MIEQNLVFNDNRYESNLNVIAECTQQMKSIIENYY